MTKTIEVVLKENIGKFPGIDLDAELPVFYIEPGETGGNGYVEVLDSIFIGINRDGAHFNLIIGEDDFVCLRMVGLKIVPSTYSVFSGPKWFVKVLLWLGWAD